MAREPYPDKELLTAAEVRHLLSVERTIFKQLLGEPAFPRPVVLGKTPKGKDRYRWRKDQVLAYILLLPPKQ